MVEGCEGRGEGSEGRERERMQEKGDDVIVMGVKREKGEEGKRRSRRKRRGRERRGREGTEVLGDGRC